MSMMASQITGVSIVYSIVVQAQIKETITALRHWPLWVEFIGDQRARDEENVSIWRRHNAQSLVVEVTPKIIYNCVGDQNCNR